MAKKKLNNKSVAFRHSKSKTANKKSVPSRKRLLVSVIGVIAVAIVAYVVFGNSFNSVSSQQSTEDITPTGKVPAEQVQIPTYTGHGPSIHFPEPSYDFGSIAQGDKVSHTFVVRNKGDEPLKLIRAHGS